VLSYCTALGIDHGLIVYPFHLAPIDDVVPIRNSNVEIRETALDLGGSAQETQYALDRLAASIRATKGSSENPILGTMRTA
jgi:hypothetical protein